MNILFVYSLSDIQSPARPLRTFMQIQFGISYVSSMLKSRGHNTRLLVLGRVLGKRNIRSIENCVREFSPELVCFTAVSTEYQIMAQTAARIKALRPSAFLLAGGVHVSLNPDGILNDCFDGLCIGEGEYPVLELAGQLEKGARPSGIPNMWFKHGPTMEKNAPRPFLEDLDKLPFPDMDMWREWVDEKSAEFSVLLGRGCPFLCTYCCNHALKKISPGKYLRMRSADNVVAEIRGIAAKFPVVREIYLEVETIGANHAWALELCSKLESMNRQMRNPPTYGTNIRVTPGADYDRLFAALKKSNFRFVNIGLESGSERVRTEVLKRIYSNDDIVKAASSAKKHGLQLCFFNLVGLPGETPEDFEQTIKVNRECQPDWHFLSIFFPYPGTELHALCKQRGLLDGPVDTEMERARAVLDLPEFPKEQVQKYFTWFDYHVYRGHRPLYKILARVLVTKMKSNPYLNYLYRNITRMGLFSVIKEKLKK